jgi:hypothetical protein
VVDEPFNPNSPIARALANMDFSTDPPVVVRAIEIEADQMPRQVVYIPAVLLLALVWLLQARRRGTANPFTA